jgi:predicted DNA-binding protein with PD1-like motif
VRTYPSNDGQAAFIRLGVGEDLLEGLTAGVNELGLRAGTLQVIGAVSRLVVGYYDQTAREYLPHAYEGRYEIASGLGNVSVKDDQAFVHLHVVASGADWNTVGGHVMPGCVVFLGEGYVRALDGEPPVRNFDDETGLLAWGG